MAQRSEIDRSDKPPQRGAKYIDVHRIRNSDGLVCVISQRNNGLLTFAISREYEDQGAIGKTAFIGENLIESYKDFVELVVEQIGRLRETGQGSEGPLPFPVREPAPVRQPISPRERG